MSKANVRIRGLEELQAQLGRITNATEDVIEGAITDLVLLTHSKAVTGIQHGPKSGKTYRRGNVTHRASAPGQYPASDTGRLATGVLMELPAGNMTGRVGTNVVHGEYLEFGTSRMAARPWLFPSFEDATRNVAADLQRRFDKSVK